MKNMMMKLAYLFFCAVILLFSAAGPASSPVLAFDGNASAFGQGGGEHLRGNMVNLRWNDLGAGFTYHFQMARDEYFREILIDERSDKPEISFPEPAAAGAYYVRIRPIGPDGQAGNFSTAQRYETEKSLDPPVITSPEEIAEYRDVYEVRAAWNKVPRAAVYHVVLARDRMFRNIIYDNPSVAGTALTLWNLDYGTYFLRVGAVSEDGAEGPFSQTVSFIVVPPVPMITTAE